MRRTITWLLLGVPVVLFVAAAGAVAAIPTLRHIASGFWNVPDRLPTLPDNSQVHYQLGAENCARTVSTLLASAISRTESIQGRPFAHPVTVGVYATREAYEAANGLGTSRPVGVTFIGRVNLSPVLCGRQRDRLPAILTHELSHAHIQSWITASAYIHLPNWFKEGLAVMVSEGGGAEFVSEQEARAAVLRGEHIAIDAAWSLYDLADIRFGRPPAGITQSHLTVLAYRQSGMFVSFLRDSDGPAFALMMTAVLDGRPLAEAVNVGYHEDVQSLWQKFVQASHQQK
jgi:hypothetical protein